MSRQLSRMSRYGKAGSTVNADVTMRKASGLLARLSAVAGAESPDVGVASLLQREVHAFAARHREPVPAALSVLADTVVQRAQDYWRDPADAAARMLWIGRVEGALRAVSAVFEALVEAG